MKIGDRVTSYLECGLGLTEGVIYEKDNSNVYKYPIVGKFISFLLTGKWANPPSRWFVKFKSAAITNMYDFMKWDSLDLSVVEEHLKLVD